MRIGWIVVGLLGTSCAGLPPGSTVDLVDLPDRIRAQSAFYRVEMARDQPAFTAFSVDSLGRGKTSVSALRKPGEPAAARGAVRRGAVVEYGPAWTFTFSGREIRMRSRLAEGSGPPTLAFDFDPMVCHATLLGRMDENGRVRLPALLHLPDQGTFRVTALPGAALDYAARRWSKDFVRIAFEGASRERPEVEYRLEVVSIHPPLGAMEDDPRFDGFRRCWLNVFQLNPAHRVLANHAASDPVPFTVFKYAEMAQRTPPLAEGLTAMDLVRDTLERYLGGMKGYGQVGYGQGQPGAAGWMSPYDSLDTYPSLLLSSWIYVRSTGDLDWLGRRYGALRGWASKMLEGDRDGNGLLEYPVSGNSGSWTKKVTVRPANWWDTVGFGHEDAYSNALAYPALRGMADLAGRIGRPDDAREYAARADKLRSAYYPAFFNPATGLLAGWKSADGKLHDYAFTFVNGIAVSYGLVTRPQAEALMAALLAKLREAGYARFDLGLPGNLVPVRREDYVHLEKRWGGPEKEDGSDGFQVYENGGATACYAYYTLQALYDVGRRGEADRMLFPMLESFDRGYFQGRGPNGKTYDWKAWDGTPHGYEGLLTDGYLTLLGVLAREGRTR